MNLTTPALAGLAAGAIAFVAGCAGTPSASTITQDGPMTAVPSVASPAGARPAAAGATPQGRRASTTAASEKAQADQHAREAARQANLRREAAEVRERYIQAHPELAENVRAAILNQQVIPGMTAETVFVSLGVPERATKRVSAAGTSEQWSYAGRTLYFYEGILSSYTEDR